jgi:hypothetical protein
MSHRSLARLRDQRSLEYESVDNLKLENLVKRRNICKNGDTFLSLTKYCQWLMC